MATATKPRKPAQSKASPTRRAKAKAGRPKPSPQAAKKKAASTTTKAVVKSAKPGGKSLKSRLAGTAAKKSLKFLARRAVHASTSALEAVAQRGSGRLVKSVRENGLTRPLPIQVSVDVAAPLDVVWDEWMQSGTVFEGVHRIENVKRKGDRLSGTVAGPRGGKWRADILDEREHESFAWRSTQGSDCAGLVTFHRLSERLTRVELDLDVLPTKPAEALTLTLHVAQRHAEADLRRFKAHVEFINPDVYESN